MSISSTSSVEAIIAEIDKYIRQHGGSYSAWYCGIAADPKDRLFVDHKVNRDGAWIHRDAGTDVKARKAEAHFLSLGCRGGGGGGNSQTRHVYAYLMTQSTCETC